MVPAKLALPVASGLMVTQMSMEGAIGNRLVLVSALPGCLMTSQLARQLAARRLPVIWLRANQEDADPATLLLDLAAGCDMVAPGASAHVLDTLRRRPGSVYGWPALFETLARDLADALPAFAEARPVLVIEHVDACPEAASLLGEHFLTLLPQGTTGILTRHGTGARAGYPYTGLHLGARDLRFDAVSTTSLARQAGIDLSSDSLIRLTELADGRAAAIVLLLEQAQRLGCPTLSGCMKHAQSLEDLLPRVIHAALADASHQQRASLALACQVDYLHPDLLSAAFGQQIQLPEGWLQVLNGGWMRLPCVVQTPMRASLAGMESDAVRDALHRSVPFFLQQGMAAEAVRILFDPRQEQEAAQVIAQVAEMMLDRGQWQTLSNWIDRLPERVRRGWPWLLYYQGEIAAACGKSPAAHRTFSLAVSLFAEKGELSGVCQSLLSQSSLSALHQRPQEAYRYARQLNMVAELGNLGWYLSWARWQLGCLAAHDGQVEEALSNFRRAADTASSLDDPQLVAFINEARALAQTNMEQQQQIEAQRQMLLAAEHEQQETLARLRQMAEKTSEGAAGLLGHYGWARTPLLLKLPHGLFKNLWLGRLPAWISSHLPGQIGRPEATEPNEQAFVQPALSEPAEVLHRPLAMTEGVPAEELGAARLLITPPAALASAPDPPAMPHPPPPAAVPVPVTAAPPTEPTVNAFLLGGFRVMVNDVIVENWPGGRGRAIFAFLLLQHSHSAHREVLMDTFWPDAGPDAARNNLNVAIHNLRGVFRQELTRPVILREENAYRIDPQLGLWLDFSAFEQHIKSGEQSERAGSTSGAISAYEAAIQLYQGDFLADHPFEEWAILERERLRVLYLETLDHLSLAHFNAGNYRACISLCQRLVTYDSCREDAHCRLMRCYYYEGQAHLALRQYQVCVESLRSELSVGPSPATVELYDQIRRRTLV